MNISDVAKKNRLNQQSDSFYEEKGLVTPPLRSETATAPIVSSISMS